MGVFNPLSRRQQLPGFLRREPVTNRPGLKVIQDFPLPLPPDRGQVVFLRTARQEAAASATSSSRLNITSDVTFSASQAATSASQAATLSSATSGHAASLTSTSRSNVLSTSTLSVSTSGQLATGKILLSSSSPSTSIAGQSASQVAWLSSSTIGEPRPAFADILAITAIFLGLPPGDPTVARWVVRGQSTFSSPATALTSASRIATYSTATLQAPTTIQSTVLFVWRSSSQPQSLRSIAASPHIVIRPSTALVPQLPFQAAPSAIWQSTTALAVASGSQITALEVWLSSSQTGLSQAVQSSSIASFRSSSLFGLIYSSSSIVVYQPSISTQSSVTITAAPQVVTGSTSTPQIGSALDASTEALIRAISTLSVPSGEAMTATTRLLLHGIATGLAHPAIATSPELILLPSSANSTTVGIRSEALILALISLVGGTGLTAMGEEIIWGPLRSGIIIYGPLRELIIYGPQDEEIIR